MQTIDFTLPNFTRFELGKKTTVRLGQNAYQLGPVKLTCSEEQLEYDSEIIEIRTIRFGDIGLAEATADGFNTVEVLRHELERCYEKFISDFEPVTIVRLKI
ncbi:hypothetical protein R7P75_04715 [Vibrio sp. 2175-1]|uniref:ASCH domain-containing protein n=1 Tax=Vibrio TaxID=662 RepID=UPI001CDCC045|nr:MULTISPECIES: ASCH domain-containing protein [Vibrio]MCA2497821.1 hypothetical protein [Vibrio alginolyticus]MDW2217508.1 hypothetical protein [Vibrio sp. 2175-1]